MADITNINIRIPGVNAATNFVQEYAFGIDFVTLSGIAATGTHSIFKLPKGEALVGLRVIAVESATSGGAATLQFKVSVNGTAANINSSTVALAGLAKGMVQRFNASGIKTFDSDVESVIQMTVGTAAYTGGKLLVIAETIPVDAYKING